MLDWRVVSVFSFEGCIIRILSSIIRLIIFLSLAVKVVFISRMTVSSLIFICQRQFLIERGEEGESPEEEIIERISIEVGILREEIDERVLDRAWWIYMILTIMNAHIFLLINIMLYDKDMKDYEWIREIREWKFEMNDDNIKKWMKIFLSIFYWLKNNIILI